MDDTIRIEIILLLKCPPTIFLYFVFSISIMCDPHEIKQISVRQNTIVLLTLILIVQFLTLNWVYLLPKLKFRTLSVYCIR